MINKQPSLYEHKYGDVPAYLMKSRKPVMVKRDITASLIFEVVSWAEKEYFDTRSYYEAMQDYLRLDIVKRRSMLDVLASSKIFKGICRAMTQEEWDALPKAYKKFIAKANKLRLEKYTHKSGR